jgi:hypothetical protein
MSRAKRVAALMDSSETLSRDTVYPQAGVRGWVKGAQKFRWSGEYREPKKGEWYLSGSVIEAYQAPNNLSQKFHIAVPTETPQVRSTMTATPGNMTASPGYDQQRANERLKRLQTDPDPRKNPHAIDPAREYNPENFRKDSRGYLIANPGGEPYETPKGIYFIEPMVPMAQRTFDLDVDRYRVEFKEHGLPEDAPMTTVFEGLKDECKEFLRREAMPFQAKPDPR